MNTTVLLFAFGLYTLLRAVSVSNNAAMGLAIMVYCFIYLAGPYLATDESEDSDDDDEDEDEDEICHRLNPAIFKLDPDSGSGEAGKHSGEPVNGTTETVLNPAAESTKAEPGR